MADFVQTLITTIEVGSLYGLIALGYTMVYGILKLINFAHSDIVVLGAWVSYTLATFFLPRLGMQVTWYAGGLVLVASMIICGAVGLVIERFAYKPIRNAPRLNALITAIAVSLFLQNTGQLSFTIVPAEKTIASGKVLERGADPKTVRLAEPITLASGTHQLRLQPADTTAVTVRKITAPPGTYPANSDIAIDQPIGRAQTRNATYTLLRVSTPLRL